MRSFIAAMQLLNEKPKYVPQPKIRITNDKVVMNWHLEKSRAELVIYNEEAFTITIKKDNDSFCERLEEQDIFEFPECISEIYKQ